MRRQLKPRRRDSAKFRADLLNIARTTLSSKVLNADKDYFATLAVDAVLRLKVRGRPCICHGSQRAGFDRP